MSPEVPPPPQVAKPAIDEPLELHYSWFQTLWMSALWAYFAGSILYWAVGGLVGGDVLIAATGVLALLVFGPLLLTFVGPLWHAWTHKGPVLTLDARGVTDRRKKKAPFIPWPDIGQMWLGSGSTASWLCFEFRRPDRERADPPPGWLAGGVLKRVRFLSDWNVDLRPLACRKADVLRRADRLHKQELRQRVVRMNKHNQQGWSGSL